MDNTAYYTLGQAAKAVGKSKGTISNAIKNGWLSSSRNIKGHLQLDKASVHNLYNGGTISASVDQPKEQENKALDHAVKVLEETINDLQSRLTASEADRRAAEARVTALIGYSQGGLIKKLVRAIW